MTYLVGMEPEYAAEPIGTERYDRTVPPPGRPARVTVVAATAFVTMLVLIAAGANQWVTNRLAHDQQHTGRFITRALYETWQTYNWRFSPASSDHHNVLLGQALLIATTLVLGTLLVVAVTRGPITFGRAFFGTWAAVAVATQVGAFVRGFVDGETAGGHYPNRVDRALFGPLAPSAYTVWAGVGLGFLTALVVATLAMATRRRLVRPAAPAAEPASFPDYVPPADDIRAGIPPWQDYGLPLPTEATTRLPDAPVGGYGVSSAYPRHGFGPAADETSQLPRVGDETPTEAFGGPRTEALGGPQDESGPGSAGDAPTETFAAAHGEPGDAGPSAEPPAGEAEAEPAQPSGSAEPDAASGPERTLFRQPDAAETPAEPDAADSPGETADAEGRAETVAEGRAETAGDLPQRPAEPAAEATPTPEPEQRDTASADPDVTRQFPRPPDDEELGHLDPEAEQHATR